MTPDSAVLEALRFIESGQSDAALQQLSRALQLGPRRFELLTTIARHAAELGALELAAVAAARAVEVDPSDADARLMFARVLVRSALARPEHEAAAVQALLDDAEVQVQACLEVAPERPRAWSLLALVQERLSRPEDAAQAWMQAHELAPEDLEITTGLAVAQAKAERFEAALPLFSRIVQARPRSADALVNLGVAYRGLEQWSEALGAFERAAALAPASARLELHLGTARVALGEPELGVDHFRKAMAIDSEALDPMLLLGRTLHHLGRDGPARSVTERARRLFPEHPEVTALAEALGLEDERPRDADDPFLPRGVASLTAECGRFNVPDLLDFLANQRATGLLVVEGAGRTGTFVLLQGVLLAARVPGVGPLGSWLEGPGELEPELQAMDCIRLGAALRARRDSDLEAIEEAVGRQGVAALLTVMSWPSERARFFAQDHLSLAHGPEGAIDVRQVLMEAMRQWDESESRPSV